MPMLIKIGSRSSPPSACDPVSVNICHVAALFQLLAQLETGRIVGHVKFTLEAKIPFFQKRIKADRLGRDFLKQLQIASAGDFENGKMLGTESLDCGGSAGDASFFTRTIYGF